MTKKNAAVAKIAEHTSKAGEHVGDLIWWSMEEVAVEASAFGSAWTSAKLDPAWLPEQPTAKRALTDAGRAAVQASDAGYLFRLADETKSLATFNLVREDRAAIGGNRNDYAVEATLGVDPHGAWFTDAPAHPVVAQIRTRFDSLFGCVQAREIRGAILRALRAGGAITVRDHGGVYWLPAPSVAIGASLRTVIEGLGNSSFSILPVHSTPEGNATLGAAVRGSIEAEIKALHEEIETFASEGARPSTLERRIAEFATLRDRASMYREILAVNVSDLDAKLGEMEQVVRAMLDAKPEEKPSK